MDNKKLLEAPLDKLQALINIELEKIVAEQGEATVVVGNGWKADKDVIKEHKANKASNR